MLSKHVRRVVSRILSASNLGVIRGDSRSSAVPQGEQDTGFWNPDEGVENTTAASTKEWDVIVVNDPKMVNAFASPGKSVFLLANHQIITWKGRIDRCLHGNSTCLQRRTRSSCRGLSWYVFSISTLHFSDSKNQKLAMLVGPVL